MEQIKLALLGYGNIGHSVEQNISLFPDLVLTHIFSRRKLDHPLYHPAEEILSHKGEFDILLLCGGSKSDLPTQAPLLAKDFSFVDSYDNHHHLPRYLKELSTIAKTYGTTTLSGCGWDPGLFSISRILLESILPKGSTHTFWGRGVSQGHSQALRSLPEVEDAIQYTVPIPKVIEQIRQGQSLSLSSSEKHHRECYVVAKEGVDLNDLTRKIREMPDYFADYYTTVTYISKEELNQKHKKLFHGGEVIRSGHTSTGQHRIGLSVQLDSNPDFTASVMLAYARGCFSFMQEGKSGAYTPLDIPPLYLLPTDGTDYVKALL